MNADEDKEDQNGKDDADVRAAEYVLGTLDPDERAQAQTELAASQEFAGLVQKWERRLGELNVLVAPVEPPPETWDKIKARVASETPVAPVVPPVEVTAPEVTAPEVTVPELTAREVKPPAADEQIARERAPVPVAAEPPRSADVVVLARRVRRWRRIALFTGAIAAALIALVVVRDYRPDLLPARMQPTPVIQVVEKPIEVPSPRPAQYVAVLQQDNVSPAFLLTFDLERRTLSVRRVGAEQRTGKSYELWLIADRNSGPQSLGVIGNGEFTVRPEPTAFDQVTLSLATYAVSLEPEGGSPNGKPTEVLYTGKLIQATPRGFDSVSP
jgi:anti-sigma-K factor RskA